MMAGNGELSVPPGFRFHPTDEELLYYYLRKKVSYESIDLDVIREVDLNKLEPWDLKDKCRIGSGPQNEWYFFSHKDKKYPTGTRTNRATMAGFWKATGRDKAIHLSSSKRIGMRKTLVFYTGRAPHGQKTDWIMHEYRLDDDTAHIQEEAWVVCRVFKKKNHTRSGFHPEFDDQDPINLPPINHDHPLPNHNNMDPKQNPSTNQTHHQTNYGYDPNPSYNSMYLPQLISSDHSTLPSSFLTSLPLTAVDLHNSSGQNLLRPSISGMMPPEKFAGDWSFLDKLLATHQTVDQISKCHVQLSQVSDLVPAAQRIPPFSSNYNCLDVPADFSKYSK